MNVEQVMSRQAWTCREGDSLDVAAGLMWDHDVGAVPVLGADGKLAGIITDRDITMAAHICGLPLAAMPVGEHMSRQVFTATPALSVEAAEELMAAKQIRRLPVVGFAGEVVGIITMADLARAAVRLPRRAVDPRGVATTLSRIVEGRTAVLGHA